MKLSDIKFLDSWNILCVLLEFELKSVRNIRKFIESLDGLVAQLVNILFFVKNCMLIIK